MLKAALCAATFAVAVSGVAHAADYSFNAGVATDYVFRGIDQTGGDELQLFGGADVTQDQFYGGVWLSNTGPDGDEALEYDLYAGYKPSFGGATFDLGVIYYGYTDSDNKVVSSDLNTVEIKAGVSYPVGPVSLGAAVYYAPENGGFADEQTVYVEANAAYTIREGGPTLSAGVGHFMIDHFVVDTYTTWNAGVTFPVNAKISIDARVFANDHDADLLFGKALADESFVLTAKGVF